MVDAMHTFLNERLRVSLSGHIPGHQLDTLVATMSQLFRTVRPDLTPSKVLLAVSEPSVCGAKYCACASRDSILEHYKITIFVDRKEQGRRVTKPWVRATSMVSFGEAVDVMIARCEEVLDEARAKQAEVKEREKQMQEVSEGQSRMRLLRTATARMDVGESGVGRRVEGFEKRRGRERGFTLPSRGHVA